MSARKTLALAAALGLAVSTAACGPSSSSATPGAESGASSTAAPAPTGSTSTSATSPAGSDGGAERTAPGPSTPLTPPSVQPAVPAVPAVLAKAAERTTAAETARFTLRESVTMPGEGAIELVGEGEYVDGGNSLRLSLTVSGGPIDASAGERATVELIKVGNDLYLGGGPFAAIGGARYVRTESGELGAGAAGFGQSDPRAFLGFLRGGRAEVETVGPDTVRGIATQHLRVTLGVEDLRVLLADHAFSAEEAGTLAELLNPLASAPGETGFVLEVWVDDEDLVRRMDLDLTIAEPASGHAVGIEARVEYFDFDAPITVAAPHADEVADLSRLNLGLGG
ncbi:MAG: hypothetical protein ACKVWR_00730 [Acidimicrobiales bacterium]